MELPLAVLAGLLTLINPCVLPVLPIVLASSMQAGRWGPVALAAGMSLSFVAVGLTVAVAGRALGVTPEAVSRAGALLMTGFGLVLLVPRFSAGFATATAGVSSGADRRFDALDTTGLRGQAAGGALLGAVWSPCIGPTLGGAIALASQGESLPWAGAVMASFALGVSVVILALAYGARAAIAKRRAAMQALAERGRGILGAVFVATGLAIFFGLQKVVEIWALDTLPAWLTDFSVRF